MGGAQGGQQDPSSDRDFVLARVRQNGWALEHAHAALKRDRDIVLAAVQQAGSALQHADAALQQDRDVVLAAVQQDGGALRHADVTLRRDRDFVLAAVQLSGLALEYADPALRQDRDVVVAAVQQNGMALKYADVALRQDRDVVLVALHQNPWALEHAHSSLGRDRDFVLAAVPRNARALQQADPTLRRDRDLVLAAVRQNGCALEHADAALRRDRDVVLAAVQQNCWALQYADPVLRGDRDFVVAVLAQGRVNRPAWRCLAELGGGEVGGRLYTQGDCKALYSDPQRWESLGTSLTFRSSNYRAVHASTGHRGDLPDLCDALSHFLDMLQAFNADERELIVIRGRFTSQVLSGNFRDLGVAAAAAWVWTLDVKVAGKELCGHLNEVVRQDKLEQLQATMPLIKYINGDLVNRGAVPRRWPPSFQTYRGTGIPADKLDFFHDINKKYRVSMFVATSEKRETAEYFAGLNGSSTKLLVIFTVHIDPALKCKHVNSLEELTAVGGECEFLFPPYSAFTVLSAPRSDGRYHCVEIYAAPDNKDLDAFPEDLPTCKWH